MRYSSNDDLPAPVRENLPEHGQEIYRVAFNHAWEQTPDDDRAHRLAWAAVERSYEEINGEWLPRDRDW